MNTTIAIDPGAGAIKLYSAAGPVCQPSIIATDGAKPVSELALAGLDSGTMPTRINTETGAFYVGLNAHEWGRPIENLDPDRFNGSPELTALVYSALSWSLSCRGEPQRASVIVGLPLNILTGDEAAANAAEIKRWLAGRHVWTDSKGYYDLTITGVKLTSQPVGALMDYLLDENGHYIGENKRKARGEIGIISLGMNTVELLVVSNLQIVQRFTTGKASGVRRLLELCNPGDLYSRGEIDAKLRAGELNYKSALPIWSAEVSDVINKHWGESWKRFSAVIVTGGGALLLKSQLERKFLGFATFAHDPVISTARGLYKFALRSK